ncbi:MAG: tetratricopeptide repeat protein [Verrucomicrobiales bacterium]
MVEKSFSDIPRNVRDLYEKGNMALQKKNYDYAIAIYNQVLQNEPAFYEGRESLRAAQLRKAGNGGGFFKKLLGAASSSPSIAKAQLQLRNNPIEAISTCEGILNDDPNNVMAHKTLAEAAQAAGFTKTAILSLEMAMKAAPKDTDVALRLAEALTNAGQINRAETIYKELQRINPHDQNLSQLLKNLAAQRTMKEGGYDSLADGKGSYRDILKNKEEAVTLEQENRQVKSESDSERLLNEYLVRFANEPANMRLARSIAEIYIRQKNFDKALEYYNILASGEQGNDATLQKEITQLRTQQLDHHIQQLDQNDPEYQEKLSKLQFARQDLTLNAARQAVERYPNDLQLRFELGQLYFQHGKIAEAIQEFQKAQTNPHRRIQSLYYLGLCFSQRNMNDLAVRSLQNAVKDKPTLDDEKKDIMYALGGVLQKMGKVEEAMEYYKQIYEVDIGYKDVAAKVDQHYSG